LVAQGRANPLYLQLAQFTNAPVPAPQLAPQPIAPTLAQLVPRPISRNPWTLLVGALVALTMEVTLERRNDGVELSDRLKMYDIKTATAGREDTGHPIPGLSEGPSRYEADIVGVGRAQHTQLPQSGPSRAPQGRDRLTLLEHDD